MASMASTRRTTLKDCIAACSSAASSAASSASSNTDKTVTGLVLFVGDVAPLRTKRGDVVRVASLTLADRTATATVKLWGDRTAWIRAGRVRLGDIVRLTHVRFRQVRPGHVEGSSSWHMSATTLWRLGKFAPGMAAPLRRYVDGLLAWHHAGAYKGLFALARERSSFTSASSAASAAGGAGRTPLETMSDKDCIDVVARLKIVYGSPTSTATAAAATATSATTKESAFARGSRFAILAEDGRHVEFALKLWGTFARPGWVSELRECVGQLVHCKRLLVRHCPFMDALVLNTSPHTTIRVLLESSGTGNSRATAGRLSMGLTPSPMDLEEDAAGTNNDDDRGFDVTAWARGAKNLRGGRGAANQAHRAGKTKATARRMLSVSHLLACEVDGRIRLDAHFVRWEVLTSSSGGGSSSGGSSGGSSGAGESHLNRHSTGGAVYVDSFASIIQSLLMRVCSRCDASMNIDSNNIICCSQGCVPLFTRTDLGNEERAWKWAYREGHCVLRDPLTAVVAGGRPSEITVNTPPNVMQHMLFGIPPDALMDERSSQEYTDATGLNPRVVVARQVEALMRPGICPVRTVVDCARAVDKNGQLMLGGCTYSLCRFELL